MRVCETHTNIDACAHVCWYEGLWVCMWVCGCMGGCGYVNVGVCGFVGANVGILEYWSKSGKTVAVLV